MRLGEFYARRLIASGLEFDMLFGPAYKGITLAAAVAIAFLLPLPLQAQQGAQPATAALQAQALQSLPFGDRADFEDARRGFIAAVPDATVAGAQGPGWSMKPYAFLQPDTAGTDAAARAPDTTSPHTSGHDREPR